MQKCFGKNAYLNFLYFFQGVWYKTGNDAVRLYHYPWSDRFLPRRVPRSSLGHGSRQVHLRDRWRVPGRRAEHVRGLVVQREGAQHGLWLSG